MRKGHEWVEWVPHLLWAPLFPAELGFRVVFLTEVWGGSFLPLEALVSHSTACRCVTLYLYLHLLVASPCLDIIFPGFYRYIPIRFGGLFRSSMILFTPILRHIFFVGEMDFLMRFEVDMDLEREPYLFYDSRSLQFK